MAAYTGQPFYFPTMNFQKLTKALLQEQSRKISKVYHFFENLRKIRDG
ncbi:hypothetical protein SAMN05421768_11131 [Chryseobacterium joostei]|uniref:Uncharacterized protein n=1 Tax=Chryseobacterium joostei TaxID=112234 RepID=A0A1N7KDI4_9FLAO|nr:hypothetical protein [Chryseobacterium joostei]SIS59504.1 hypothetical protein SAMN05421768_11131 [Chryseobacterium joostei]